MKTSIRSLVLFCLILVFAQGSYAATSTVGLFQGITIPVTHSQQGVKNVWDDVTVTARFSAPGGPDSSAVTIGGFYASKDLWMVRFAPDKIGTWRYTLTLDDRDRDTIITLRDSFYCVQSNEQGFIRLGADHKRLYYSGSANLFSGIGFGDCMSATRDSILETGSFDGGYRPPGYHSGIEWNLPYLQYLIAYGDVAGFNLYRYSDGNCAYSIVKQISQLGNDYDTLHSRWTDTLFSALRQHGFRIYMTILGSPVGSSSDSAQMAAVDRYAQYCINRYGGLVDFWELTNESSPDSLWIDHVARYIHEHDPYSHMVSISWEKPEHPEIDIISPHWYGVEDVRTSDQVTADKINAFSTIQKPVIFGEQGQGAWDSLSGIRMRGRIWSALFNAGTIIFWNGTFARDCCNQYLGWPERRSVRVMQNFARLLNSSTPLHDTSFSEISVKSWEMTGDKFVAGYLRTGDTSSIIGLYTLMNVPADGKVIFYDVTSGEVLARENITAGQKAPICPTFKTDIAFIAGDFPDSLLLTDTLFRLDVNPRTYELLGNTVGVQQVVRPRVTNIGTSRITITRGFTSSPSPNASMTMQLDTTLPIILNPGQSITVPIAFTMLDTGGTAAMFSFEQSNSPAWENIAFSVTAHKTASVPSLANASKLTVTPNPTTGMVTVDHTPSETSAVALMDVLGRTVWQSREPKPQFSMDLSRFARGVYYLRFSSRSFVTTEKIVLE